jgi:hypothetical protein
MALSKNTAYTPFIETSFGYGSSELATNYQTEFPNATDIITIVIQHTSGNWDDTGHISTPVSGSAISVYNKLSKTLTCKGQRSDIDVILSNLKIFPADKPESRPHADDNTDGFKVLPYKQNQTDGSYTGEQPPAIGDTVFSISATSATASTGGTITFEPAEPNYNNQRPYWQSLTAGQDYSASAFDSDDGGSIDFGTISHGTDTENVIVNCYFKDYSPGNIELDEDGIPDTNAYKRGSHYGEFIGIDKFYVGDKIPFETSNTSSARFSMRGSIDECQAFLDNIKFKSLSSTETPTFDICLHISDGVTGSVVKKTLWHQQDLILENTIPNQTYIEDVAANFDFGDLIFTNEDDLSEANNFKAVITVDGTGQPGVQSFGTSVNVDTDTYSSGVLTIEDTNLSTLKEAVKNLEFTPTQDFNSTFTFSVVFTFENTTFGSSYSSAAQVISVTGVESSEVENIDRTHTWKEDQVYYFELNRPLRIIHPYNENFKVSFNYDVTLVDGSQVNGELYTESSETHTRAETESGITFTGTRNALNDVLKELYFSPGVDFDQSFSINVIVERTSGSNLNGADISEGVFTMTAIPQDEYKVTDPGIYSWDEDISLDFETGITILDTSLDDPLLPAFGGKFKLTLQSTYNDGTAVGDEITWSCFNTAGIELSGSGTTTDPLVLEGSRSDMNIAMNALRLTPRADFTASQGIQLQYRLERGVPTDTFYQLYIPYTAGRKVIFNEGIPSDELEVPSIVKFGEERITPIDNIKIVDAAKDKKYKLQLTMSNTGEGYLRVTDSIGVASIWDPIATSLTLTGNKSDLNRSLLTLEYVPTFDFISNFSIYYYLLQETDNITQHNGTEFIVFEYDSTLLKYNTDNSQDLFYAEDLANQNNILSFTELENLDGAAEITNLPVHYATTVRLDPTTELYFTNDYIEPEAFVDDLVEERGSELTFTGSRTECNNIIKNLSFNAIADQLDDVNVLYSQDRFLNSTFNETQADEVDGLTIRSVSDVGEATFSPWKQYFTTSNSISADGSQITPRYLQEYRKDDIGNIVNQYTVPVNIIDSGNEPGGETLYKLELISDNLQTQGMSIELSDYKTKEQFAEFVNNGIIITADPELENSLHEGQEFKIHFRLLRKLPSGTISSIEENFLTYEFRPRPRPAVITIAEKQTAQNHNAPMPTEFSGDTIEIKNEVVLQMNNGLASDTIVESSLNDIWVWGYKSRRGDDLIQTAYIKSPTVLENISSNTIEQEVNFSQLAQQSEIGNSNYPYPKAYESFAIYNITTIGEDIEATARNIIIDDFGLKNTVTINYREKTTRYSQHMSHPVSNWIGTTRGEHFGHDTGAIGAGNYGAWVVKADNPYIRDSVPTIKADATLCSHFWVREDRYAFGFMGRPEMFDTRQPEDRNSYELMGSWDDDLGTSVFGTPTIPIFNKAQFVGSANTTALRSPVARNWTNYAYQTRFLSSASSYNDDSIYDNESSLLDILSTTWGGRIFNMSKTTLLDRVDDDDTAWLNEFGNYLDDQRYRNWDSTFDILGSGSDNISALFFHSTTGAASALKCQTRTLPGRRYEDQTNTTVPVISGNYYQSDNPFSTNVPYTGQWAQDFAFPNDYIADDETYPFQWFDAIDDSLYEDNNVTWDFHVGRWETSQILKNLDENSKYYNLPNLRPITDDTLVPQNLLITRSYDDGNGRMVNEAIVLRNKHEVYSTTMLLPRWYVVSKSKWITDYTGKDVYPSGTSAFRAARRNPKDNTNRIDYDYSNNDWYLPSGDIIRDTSQTPGDARRDVLNTDGERVGPVDKWIRRDAGVVELYYIDMKEKMIKGLFTNKTISLNTKLSSTLDYNYVYATQGSGGRLYAMMGYVPGGDTAIADASVLRTRLIYINLEEN